MERRRSARREGREPRAGAGAATFRGVRAAANAATHRPTANDLAHWQTTLVVPSLENADAWLRAAK